MIGLDGRPAALKIRSLWRTRLELGERNAERATPQASQHDHVYSTIFFGREAYDRYDFADSQG